jgi:NAD(P)-dependent dehydrogenase (short-subunit alcohol dehydrogenase family)
MHCPSIRGAFLEECQLRFQPRQQQQETTMSQTLGANTTTDEVIVGADLSGKTAVITGGSAGLGVETGRTLAGAGARVVLVGRDEAKISAVVKQMRTDLPEADIDYQLMDLADLASVREAGSALREKLPQIHLLINNAGVMACPQAQTKDGFELQFGTNHLGHFLFTCLLLPSLLAATPARIVNLSSGGHRFSDVDFEDPNFEQRDYDKWVAYGQSKTANAQFSVALNQRLSGRGVTANAVHPGVIMTELGRHLQPEDLELLSASSPDMAMSFKTIPAGAATSVWAATAAELEGKGGLYLEDCQIGELKEEEGASSGYLSYALNPASAEKLWTLSEQLVGENFDFSA